MSKNKLNVQKEVSFRNKKAGFEFELLEKYSAGLMLKGSEIKSIRTGKASLTDSFCMFIGDELWVRNMSISPYESGGFHNHEAKSDRKLLLTRKELRKLKLKLQDVGLTIIPTHLYINNRGLAKLDIALAKGKKLYDKRNDLKEKAIKREIERFR